MFRGQRDANWTLETTLERRMENKKIPLDFAEDWLLAEFRRVAGRHLQPHQVPQEHLDWIALMQHYGAPTRLLDCTYSPYVAAYFALEYAAGDAAIWVFGQKRLAEAADSVTGDELDIPVPEFGVTSTEYHDLLLDKKPKGVFRIDPYFQTDRLHIQQGAFLIAGDPTVSFWDNVAQMQGLDVHKAICKVVIPSRARADALADLQRMNINRATLFPGLEGLAQSMNLRVPGSTGQRTDPIWASALNLMPPFDKSF
ncbi:MAG: FRG domain-containing protein [Thermomicrobiaceae bacterium]